MTSEQLKNSILQFAVQGKLVPQNPHDEPASELLKKIKAEKEKLIKEKVIKKDKPSPPITEEEKPFELPESWEWVRLGEIISLNSGQDLTPNQYTDFNNSGIPYITGASNIKDGQIIINRWTNTPKSIAIKGDILLTCKGTIGKIAILEEPISHIARQIMSIKYLIIPVKYLITVLETQIESYKQKANSFIPGIDRDTVLNTLFPLPPLVEQQLIVEKVEELLPLVEQYGTAESELKKLNTKFPEQLKKSVLQYAVQGKLIPQNLNDEPASILLERIKAEKKQLIKEKLIKQDKPLPVIKEDEIPFEIPDSWVWVRLGEISSLITKGSSPSWQGVNYIEDYTAGILFITSENVGTEQLLLERKKYLEPTFNKLQSRSILQKHDILTNIVGGSIGRTAEFDLELTDCNINQAVALIRLINHDLVPYLLKYMNSATAYKIMMNNQVDTARANISLTNISDFLIPLPPLSEQKLIVEKVEEVLSYCDKLK